MNGFDRHLYESWLGPPVLMLDYLSMAKWRFVYLKSSLWNQLPPELYREVEKHLTYKTMYQCRACKKYKEKYFRCECQ
jgi:hypothetical protein